MKAFVVALTVAAIACSAQAALVGVDDAFWGNSVGQVSNAGLGSVSDYSGPIDTAVAQGWADGDPNYGVAFIPPAPSYHGNAQWGIAMAGDGGQGGRFQLIVDTVESGVLTLTHPEAAAIKYDDQAFHDHTAWTFTPGNGGPRPVLYRWDVSSLSGLTINSASISTDCNWSESNKVFDVYLPGADWNETTVTYSTLIPEPATMALLGLGGLGLLIRRKK